MTEHTVRIDQWLWAARFFKTRALSAAAIAGGKVLVNGARPKRAKPVAVGDRLRVRVGPYVHDVAVRGVAARRGPARQAAKLYEEDGASRAARLKLAEQLRIAPAPAYQGKGRPTKRDRRLLDELTGEDE